MTLPRFEELEVTTQTWVIYSHLEVNNARLFDKISCVNLRHPLPRKDVMIVNPLEDIKDGEIVFAEYLGQFKGVRFRKPKEKQMRNCSTIIMKIGGKPRNKYYNIKISRKGNFHITGCTCRDTVIKILQYIWTLLTSVADSWNFVPNSVDHLLAYITCRMSNVHFTVPFAFNLKNLNYVIKMSLQGNDEEGAEYSCIYEPSVGYVGANVKIRSTLERIEEVDITKVECIDGKFIESVTKFSEYLDTLPPREKRKKINTHKYQNSFLVFSSGKTIMSGKISLKNRRDCYHKFCKLIEEHKNGFAESD
jgi:TATA-box binding protein (TBP) (component of TFIID and TFIIIB)